MTAAKARPGKDPAAARVTVTRAHHPLQGQTLRVLGRMHRHGRLELLLELTDGSKRLIPARWTDQGGQRTPADAELEISGGTAATVGAVSDLLAVCGLVSALSARARAADDRGQAARQSPCKEDSRAACAAQSAAGPGSGATGDPAGPASRRRGRRGDHAAGAPDRQSIHPGPDTDERAAGGHAGGLGTGAGERQ
jgi:Family of unknown function (DUF5372)